jgi:hypothetical protein
MKEKTTKSGIMDRLSGTLGKQGQLRTNGRKINNLDKKGTTGVYGANPTPNLAPYKRSEDASTIPVKMAETQGTVDGAMRQTNKMRGIGATRGIAPLAKTSTTKTSENRYRTVNKNGKLRTARGKI